MMPVPIGIAVLDHYDKLGGADVQYDGVTLPFAVILSLLMAFRIGDAFRKWQRADMCTQMLHSGSRTAIGKMCAYLEHTDENVAAINEVRRYLVLGAVLIKAHVCDEISKDMEEEVTVGLLTRKEQQQLSKQVATTALKGDGKKDRFPSKNRPAFAFQRAHTVNSQLQRRGAYNIPHTFMMVEQAITSMSDAFEELEHLGQTVIPLPYAQLTRLIAWLFLLELPLALVKELHWGVIPLSLAANVVYFLTDECAAEMEVPFGPDENDVPVEKTCRRIDKHTASQVFLLTGKPSPNFNIFPLTRTTQLTPLPAGVMEAKGWARSFKARQNQALLEAAAGSGGDGGNGSNGGNGGSLLAQRLSCKGDNSRFSHRKAGHVLRRWSMAAATTSSASTSTASTASCSAAAPPKMSTLLQGSSSELSMPAESRRSGSLRRLSTAPVKVFEAVCNEGTAFVTNVVGKSEAKELAEADAARKKPSIGASLIDDRDPVAAGAPSAEEAQPSLERLAAAVSDAPPPHTPGARSSAEAAGEVQATCMPPGDPPPRAVAAAAVAAAEAAATAADRGDGASNAG